MCKFIRSTCLIALLAVIAGCITTVGNDFVRPDPDKLKLGQTSYSQAIQLMGATKSDSREYWMNDKLVKSLGYYYAPSALSMVPGDKPSRLLGLSFYNDVLVGLDFKSSFKSDNTNFNDTEVHKIIKGKTSLTEVIQLIGKPNSFKIPPMLHNTNVKSVKEVEYSYSEQSRSFNGENKFANKFLRIYLDDKDLVTYVEFKTY
jgi:hypothetical protein